MYNLEPMPILFTILLYQVSLIVVEVLFYGVFLGPCIRSMHAPGWVPFESYKYRSMSEDLR